MRIATLILGLLLIATSAFAGKAPAEYPDYVQMVHERQGGDTIDDCTAIDVIPFSGSGTTVGYVDNYDEVCYYTNSTSPDVVYCIVPCETGELQISLCYAPTDYDTKLYVYDVNMNLVKCNDDWCSTPVSFVSELTDASAGDPLFGPVPVNEGDTYYIVVDGYGGSLGNYGLEISGMDCTTPAESMEWGQVKSLY